MDQPTQSARMLPERAVQNSLDHPTERAVNFYADEQAWLFQNTGRNYLSLVRRGGLDSMVAALWGESRLWYMGEQLFLKEGGRSRCAASLRSMGPDIVYDARVRDRKGAQAGNDAALGRFYSQLQDGQPFHPLGTFQSV